MCGIAGIFASSKAAVRSEAALNSVKTMTQSFVHRGPDGHGFWADETGRCFFGHRRLSIIDTSDAGLQPMTGADGRWVITFNGEIYNYLELRRELEAAGIRFKGRTDTEVLIEAIALWGEKALPKLDGMFAFAAFDRLTGKIFLARDAFGEKPLYYTTLANGALAFASELQALEGLPGFDPMVSLDAMAEVLSFQYIGAPRSIYASVRKLHPGTWLAIDADGSQTSGRYFQFAPKGSSVGLRSIGDLADELEDILVRSLERRLIADVPLGAFLSGGVDSSVVCALVRRKLNRPLKTFSTGFSDAPESEHLTARAFAEHLGTEHRENVVSPDVSAFLDDIGDLLDEPNGDSSCLPTFLLSKFVREHVTVAISGDGGDEMFGGYGRYLATMSDLHNSKASSFSDFRPGEIYYGNRILVGQEPFIQSLFGMLPGGYAEHVAQLRAEVDRSIPDGLLEEMRRSDTENYLPGAVLPKVDRMSMRCSLEVRTPFLNMELARFAERLPESVLMQNGRGKIVLRELAYRYLPRELIDLPKQGFGLPMSDWARGSLLQAGEKVLLGDEGRLAAAFGHENIRNYLELQSTPGQFSAYQAWGVVMLESWLQKHPAVIPDLGGRTGPAKRKLRPQLDAIPVSPTVFVVAEGNDAPDRDPTKNAGFAHLGSGLTRRIIELATETGGDLSKGIPDTLRLPFWGEALTAADAARLSVLQGATLLFADDLAMQKFDYPEYEKLTALGIKRVTFANPYDPSELYELDFKKVGWFQHRLSLARLFRHRLGGASSSRKLRKLLKLNNVNPSAEGYFSAGPFSDIDPAPDQELAARYAIFEGGRQLLPVRGAHADLPRQAGRYSIWNQGLFFSPTDPSRVARRPYWIVPMSPATAKHLPIRARHFAPGSSVARDVSPQRVLAQLTPSTPISLKPGDRVVVCTHGLPPGGAERQWVYLAQSLEEAGYEVIFVTYHSLAGVNSHYLPDLVKSNIAHVDATQVDFFRRMQTIAKYPVLREMAEDWVANPSGLLQLAATFDRLQPKAVFSQLDEPNLLAGLAGLAVNVPRVVLSFRNYNPTNFPYLNQAWMLPAYQLLSRSQGIVLSGNFNGANDDYADWIGAERSRVAHVPNVIEPSLFPIPTSEALRAARQALELPEAARVVLGVFRLSPEKDPLLFVDICTRLCRKNPDVHALIAGSGPMHDELAERIRDAGLEDRIRLLGRRSDVNTLMSLSTLLLQTSRHEGMPNAVMEAQFLGLPVVGTRAGGTADTVIDGKSALLADLGDGDTLFAHCATILLDPKKAKSMGAAGRRNILANFQKSQLGRRYLRAVDSGATFADTPDLAQSVEVA